MMTALQTATRTMTGLQIMEKISDLPAKKRKTSGEIVTPERKNQQFVDFVRWRFRGRNGSRDSRRREKREQFQHLLSAVLGVSDQSLPIRIDDKVEHFQRDLPDKG